MAVALFSYPLLTVLNRMVKSTTKKNPPLFSSPTAVNFAAVTERGEKLLHSHEHVFHIKLPVFHFNFLGSVFVRFVNV
jgi:hypothetical protein